MDRNRITTERDALIFRIEEMYKNLMTRFKELQDGVFSNVPYNMLTGSFHTERFELAADLNSYNSSDYSKTLDVMKKESTDLSGLEDLDLLLNDTLSSLNVQLNLPSVDTLMKPRGHLIENVHSGEYPNERSNENDHWLLTDDGFLEFHGGGWIKDEYGYILGSDGKRIGSNGIQSGLEDLYSSFSREEKQDDIIDLILDARINYFIKDGVGNNRKNWYWDLEENEGKKIPIPKEISDFLRMRQYNMDNNESYSAVSFLPGGSVQQGFSTGAVSYIYMNTSDGKKVLYNETHVQLKYVHNGVDITGRGSIKSPGYYKVIQKANHRLTLERIGTDRHTTIRHLDPSAVSALPQNKVFKPGDIIISYPTSSHGPGSGIHIHVEENRLSGGERYFCDPDSHSGAYPGNMYYLRYIIEKDGKEIKLPEIYNYSGETYRFFPRTNPR